MINRTLQSGYYYTWIRQGQFGWRWDNRRIIALCSICLWSYWKISSFLAEIRISYYIIFCNSTCDYCDYPAACNFVSLSRQELMALKVLRGAFAIELEKRVDKVINNRFASSNYNHHNNNHVIHLKNGSTPSVFSLLSFFCHLPWAILIAGITFDFKKYRFCRHTTITPT